MAIRLLTTDYSEVMIQAIYIYFDGTSIYLTNKINKFLLFARDMKNEVENVFDCLELAQLLIL